MIRKHLFLVLGLSAAAAVNAGVYTWTDADGRVHYSDKPVAGAQTLDIRTAPTDPTRIEAERKQAEEKQAADADAQKKAAEVAKLASDDAAKRDENCKKAQSRRSAITSAQRPYRTAPDGERHYLSAEEIDAEIKEAEAGVAQWCSS
jgi:hypothetical protein